MGQWASATTVEDKARRNYLHTLLQYSQGTRLNLCYAPSQDTNFTCSRLNVELFVTLALPLKRVCGHVTLPNYKVLCKLKRFNNDFVNF